MAKTIKFNLRLDNTPVKDIKGLQENFCIDDILAVYENGLLLKWLKVRGYEDYFEKVTNIDENESIIIELIKIFDIQKDNKEILEAIYSLEFQEQRKKDIEKFKQTKNDLVKVIDNYHNSYNKLIDAILENKENMPFLKIVSKEISDKYIKLFELNYETLYHLFKKQAPLMIYAILMNIRLRQYFTKNRTIVKDLYDNFMLSTQDERNNFFYNNFKIFKDIEESKDV